MEFKMKYQDATYPTDDIDGRYNYYFLTLIPWASGDYQLAKFDSDGGMELLGDLIPEDEVEIINS